MFSSFAAQRDAAQAGPVPMRPAAKRRIAGERAFADRRAMALLLGAEVDARVSGDSTRYG
jgi:hypothetical protein